MEKKKLFVIASWGTLLISIFVIFDAFNPYILDYGDFYLYLILICGILGILGALLTLGILSLMGGLVICISLLVSSVVSGLSLMLLASFLKALGLLIGGCGMILTYEDPNAQYELPQLGMGKTEYFALKDLGITTLEALLEEKGNEAEICSITSISISQLKELIRKAEEIIHKRAELQKNQLRKDFKEKYKK